MSSLTADRGDDAGPVAPPGPREGPAALVVLGLAGSIVMVIGAPWRAGQDR
jgi:hypothetical protein